MLSPGTDAPSRGNEETRPPLVSIIIPCFNHAGFLPEAIETALGQTYSNVEVIVVDDGSTDGSSAVAGRYPRVHGVRQENRGPAAARNTGIANSEGEYLLFLDADNRLLLDAIEQNVQAARRHPDCGFVFGRFHVMNLTGARLLTSDPPRLERSPYAELLSRNWIISHSTVLYRRQAFEEVGLFDESLLAGEDYDMYMRVACKLPIAGHPVVVAEVRKHAANLTRNYPRMLHYTLEALKGQWTHVRGNPDLVREYQKGVVFWKGWYGRKLATEMKVARFEGRRRKLLRGLAVLARYHSRGLWDVLLTARRSNRVDFVVSDLEPAGTTPAPHAPQGGGLHLRRLGSSWTRPREAFSVQSNGESALWLECENASASTVIVFRGVPLDTIYGGPTLLTAYVPRELYAEPGRYGVYLVD